MMKNLPAKKGRERPVSRQVLNQVLTLMLRVAKQVGVDTDLETPCVSCQKLYEARQGLDVTPQGIDVSRETGDDQEPF